ncbi:NAA30 acetyltransferase, partial [Amia calva]|nr:NAA30 acetyltransferase [Amia calva]
MAAVPPGPSALPASPAESIPFPGAGCAVPGEGEERGCGRGDTTIPGAGQQQQICEGKGASKGTQNHLYSHPAALHFHTQTQQQLNGLISSAEDGLPCTHPNRLHSHHHHPAHRPPDSPGGLTDHCDSTGGARGGAPENNNVSDSNNRDCQQQCPQQNHSFSNNNNSINSMLALARTEPGSIQLAAEETGRKGEHGRTEPRPSPADPPDGEKAEDGEGLGTQGAGVELATALDAAGTSQAPVSEMARLGLNSSPEEEEEEEEEMDEEGSIQYVRYESELQMPDIMRLITKDLSEPYSIYTYRYFIHNWPQLCFLAMVREECVGAIVCKLDMHKKMFRRGYIAMLAVDSKYRRKGIGTNLVKKAIYAMVDGDCDEVCSATDCRIV